MMSGGVMVDRAMGHEKSGREQYGREVGTLEQKLCRMAAVVAEGMMDMGAVLKAGVGVEGPPRPH